jgi:hypothetical protein
MKFLMSLVIAFSAAFATANEAVELNSNETVFFDGENMTFADEEGQVEQLQCEPGQRPVVSCQDINEGPSHRPPRRPRPDRYRRCRPAYRTCYTLKGDRFCVPKPKLCPKS